MTILFVLLAFTATVATDDPPDKNTLTAQLEECGKKIELMLANTSASFDVKIKNKHIELAIRKGDKLDYYEMSLTGHCCYTTHGLSALPTRTEMEQEDCDEYTINVDDYKCDYEIYDDNDSIMVNCPLSTAVDRYAENKRNGTINYRNKLQPQLATPNLSHYRARRNSKSAIDYCLDIKDDIPKNLPISFEITKQNIHIDILVHYQNQFDHFKISWEGYSCYRDLGGKHKPNGTVDVNDCESPPVFPRDYGSFSCGIDTWTTVYDEVEYFMFYIRQRNNDTWGLNGYVINKSSNKVTFLDLKDGYNPSEIFNRFKKVNSTIATRECLHRFPERIPHKFEIITKNWRSDILFHFDDKVDYYKISWNGTIESVELRLEESPIIQLEDPPEMQQEPYKCPYEVIDDIHYSIILIRDTTLKSAYVYLINMETFDVTYQFYTMYLDKNTLKVPIMSNAEFKHDMENCVNQTALLPAAFNTTINKINNHIRITVGYAGKYDYYDVNSDGEACFVALGLSEPIDRKSVEADQCEKRKLRGWFNKFNCAVQITKPENDHYVALNIISSLMDFKGGSYTYLLDTMEDKVEFRQYKEDFSAAKIFVTERLNRSSAYVEECLNLRYAIPDNVSLHFNVTQVNDHMEISVYDNGQYDLYAFNAKGYRCYTEIRKAEKPTVEKEMNCDGRMLGDPLTEEFRCGYEVNRNESNFVIIIVNSTNGVYEYIVDKQTDITELYRYEVFYEKYGEQLTKCSNKMYASDVDIPLEVNSMGNFLEILVKYQEKYDLYVTEKSGYVRYMEMQLPERPNYSFSDYAKKTRCRGGAANFRCPLKVVENANFVNISVNAFHFQNVYVIDKSNMAVEYFKVKDKVVNNLPIPDAELNYMADVDQCMEKLTNLTSPFPIDVVRHKNFLQISVKFNDSFYVFETTSSGKQMCRINEGLSELPPVSFKLLDDIYPDCVYCNAPEFAFACPLVEVDEYGVKISDYRDDGGYTEYHFKQNVWPLEPVLEITIGVAEPPLHVLAGVPNVIKSLVG